MIYKITAIAAFALLLFGTGAYAEDIETPKDKIMFNLGEHVEILEDEPCSICHPVGAPSIMTPLYICLECHEQEFVDRVEFPAMKTHGPLWSSNHGKLVKSGLYRCSTCHEQSTCLACHKAGPPDEFDEPGNNMANIHRSDFQVSHPIAAKTDSRLCSTCHENRFCYDCHSSFLESDNAELSFSSHKKSWRSIQESFSGNSHSIYKEELKTNPGVCNNCHPDSVLPNHTWTNSHAREARRNLGVCQTCHPNGDTCLTCHSAISGLGANPHPRDWDDMKNRLRNASDSRTCRKCHIGF